MQFANALRSRKRFRLTDFFTDATDETVLNMVDVQTRLTLRHPDGGKQELDIVAQSNDNRMILIEVKNQRSYNIFSSPSSLSERVEQR